MDMFVQLAIFGDGENEPNREGALMLSMESCKLDLPLLLAQKLALLDFESRKDAAQVETCALLGSTLLTYYIAGPKWQ